MAYRIMAYQETGEEICVSDNHTQEEAHNLVPQAMEDHPEWSRFSVEYMKTADDYMAEQRYFEDDFDDPYDYDEDV